jgi:predicted DNA-binding transcriptional regulator AlpA
MPLLDVSQAAARCGLSISFLNKRRICGGGPKYCKLGKAVRYRDTELDAWISAQMRGSTVSAAPAPPTRG